VSRELNSFRFTVSGRGGGSADPLHLLEVELMAMSMNASIMIDRCAVMFLSSVHEHISYLKRTIMQDFHQNF